jgi:hypothetical protein
MDDDTLITVGKASIAGSNQLGRGGQAHRLDIWQTLQRSMR